MNNRKNQLTIFIIAGIVFLLVINYGFFNGLIILIGIWIIFVYCSNKSMNSKIDALSVNLNDNSEFMDEEKRVQRQKIETICEKIKMDLPDFNPEKFLNITRMKMVNLYKSLKDNDYLFLDNIVEKDFISDLKNMKSSLFEFGEVDFLTVHGRKIIDYRRNNKFNEIDVRLNAIHIDYMNNNIVDYHPTKKKYIEDTYILTFKAPSYYIESENKNKCDRCGAIMKRDRGMSLYRCEYCGNAKVLEYEEWKISNIVRID